MLYLQSGLLGEYFISAKTESIFVFSTEYLIVLRYIFVRCLIHSPSTKMLPWTLQSPERHLCHCLEVYLMQNKILIY
jgi:hypothetical protein